MSFFDPPSLPTIFDEDITSAPTERPPIRTFNEDGTVHFSELKKIDLSGKHYLHGVNTPIETTRAMRIGTGVHFFTLGLRQGAKRLAHYLGDRRTGAAWELFADDNADAEILTHPEWTLAQEIAEALRAHPLAQRRLEGARLEVPLVWEECGLKFSTSGIDIVGNGAVGDLKSTFTTQPIPFQRHAFRMQYPQQVALYRRAARANGIDVSKGCYLLGIETKGPYDVVDLELTEDMLDFADRSISLWIERLRGLIASCPRPRSFNDWPGYAQSPIAFDLPDWMRKEDDGEDDDLEDAHEAA